MERFVCTSAMANRHSTPAPERLAALGITTPEQLHRDPGAIVAAARELAEGGWVTLPFCNTLCGEGLGAHPSLSLEGARVREPAYQKVEDLPETLNLDFPRMKAMQAAMNVLNSEHIPVSYEVEGHFTLLNALLPMGRMFAALRKPAGAELMERTETWVRPYARMAVEHGATVLSFSDPVATVDILGEKFFTGTYLPACLRLIGHLRKDNPGVVEGDTHDIGKNLVKIMMETAGFDVHDLGRDVPVSEFISKAKEMGTGIVCMSTLMTTTMGNMKKVIDGLVAEGIRDQFKVMVGGGPLSTAFAEKIGADAYTSNAAEAAKRARELVATA